MFLTGFSAGLDHRSIRNPSPTDLESCPSGEHRQEFSLSTTVPFTKGMDEVDFSEHGPCFFAEGFQVAVEIAKKVRAGEPLCHHSEPFFNLLVPKEHGVTFAGIHHPGLSSPRINILEDVAMNGTKMGK